MSLSYQRDWLSQVFAERLWGTSNASCRLFAKSHSQGRPRWNSQILVLDSQCTWVPIEVGSVSLSPFSIQLTFFESGTNMGGKELDNVERGSSKSHTTCQHHASSLALWLLVQSQPIGCYWCLLSSKWGHSVHNLRAVRVFLDRLRLEKSCSSFYIANSHERL